MKVAPIHRAFEKYSNNVQHLIVHTGQHYDEAMSDSFFKDLNMPKPSVFLGVGSGSHAEQTAKIMTGFEKVCIEEKPDMVLVAGDVNSTIACALTAVKLGIKLGHVEAGLRSFDRTMPEEINRIATDAICDFAFVTEQSAINNLLKEGWSNDRIFWVGNTMIDSLKYALPLALNNNTLSGLGLKPREYVLLTLHRPSNVDNPEQFKNLVNILVEFSAFKKIVFPMHPRTLKNIKNFGLETTFRNTPSIYTLNPAGYIDFLALMINADFVLTDSGGIQEETTALQVQCITIRRTTERPVTCELGTNILVDPEPGAIRSLLSDMFSKPRKTGITPPLWDGRASERIVEVIMKNLFID